MEKDPFGTIVYDPVSDPFGEIVATETSDPFGEVIEDASLLEKIKEKIPEPVKQAGVGVGTVLGGALRQISRPGYAVTTALNKLAEGEMNPIEYAKAVKEGFMLEDTKKAGYDILSTMEKKGTLDTGIPTIDDNKYRNKELEKRIGGFGIDVATDPLNIFAPGIAKGVTKAGKAIGKAALPLAKTKAGQIVGGAFSRNFALKTKFPELASKADELDDIMKYGQFKSISEAKRIKDLVPDTAERNLLRNILDDPKLKDMPADSFEGLSRAGKKVLGFLKRRQRANELGYVERGMLAEDRLMDAYVRHSRVDKPGFLGTIKKALAESKPVSLMRRKVAGTVEEINNKMGKPFFEGDMAILHGIQNTEARKAFAAHDYLRQIADNPGIAKPLEEGLTAAGKKIVGKVDDGYAIVKHPVFEGKQVPIEVAEYISNMQKTLNSDKSINAFIKTFDKVQNFWKGQVLISPAYHSRNMIGNLWNNWLGGVNRVDDYVNAGKLQMAARKGDKFANSVVVTLNGKAYRGKELMGLARKHGVLDEGFFGADIPESVMEQMQKLSWNPKDLSNFRPAHLIRWNREVGSVIENNARMAHFLNRLDKGEDAGTAAMNVKKFLFDYSDLAPFEKSGMKRLFPFYSWTRKNIPLQVSNMFTQPGKYGVLEKGLRSAQMRGEPEDFENMPPYLRDKFFTPLFKREGEVYGIVGEGYLPAMDVNRLTNPVDEAVSMLSPFIKTPIEQYFNQSSYFKQPLARTPGQTQPWGRPDIKVGGVPMGVDVPSRSIQPWLSQIRVANEANRLVQKPSGVEGLRFMTGGKLYSYDPKTTEMRTQRNVQREINDLKAEITINKRRIFTATNKASKEHAKREVERLYRDIVKIYKEEKEERSAMGVFKK